MLRQALATLLLLGVGWSASLHGQPNGEPGKGGSTKSGSSKTEPKKYDEVITKDAKTQSGVFAVHRIGDRVFFEIPQSALGKLMLWQAEVAKGPAGVSWGGKSLGHTVLRWERRENKIFLWQASFNKRAVGTAIARSVESANQEAIIASFPVEAEGKDRSAVINVTGMFVTDMADLSVKGAVGAGGLIDSERSWIEEVKAFPTNIEVRSLLTFRGGGSGLARGPLPLPMPSGGAGKSFTALVHYSLVLLPETPMMGRYFDPRVGYFVESYEDYSSENSWMVTKKFINRFRLEKKDPAAAVSEPVKPIVFYLSPEIPEKWRPYMKKGVEDWKVAFEKAGFKNAIICKDPPSKAEDPLWDPEDARYSVIRWVAEPVANAMGPHVHDPRSGEVISAHIIFWHDILKITQQWYFVQCSAQDEKARKLPLPDELTGELMRYVTAHEVGHTIGLRHNHRASSAYSIEQLRSPEFTAKNGTVASIMAYGRFNYVAQPEDKVKRFIPVIGPYDIFAIEWGYKPIPDAKTPEAEKPTLDKWASRQMNEPNLRFGGEDGPASVDPTVKTENIGSDSIKATELGLKNLDRVIDHLLAATTRTGEDFSLLEDTYKAIMMHRSNWFRAVLLNVGGVIENRTLGGRGNESFTRVPKERQKEAVKFLLDNALTTPKKLLSPAIVNRFKYEAVAGDIMAQQAGILRSLLSTARLQRLMDAEIMAADQAYTVLDLFADVQNGVWSELGTTTPRVDPLRRALQRAYLERLKSELLPQAPAEAATPTIRGVLDTGSRDSDLRAVARFSLQDLQKRLQEALPKTKDGLTKAHFQDALKELDLMLAGKR